MKKMILKTTAVLTILCAGSAHAATGGSSGRSAGAGLSFPSAHQSERVNSSTLSEAGPLAMQGLWGFNAEALAVYIASGKGKFGWGLGWRDAGLANQFDAGVGFNLGGLLFGTNLYTTDFNGLNGDLTLAFELSKLRLSFGLRGIDDGLDRLDVGLGLRQGTLLFSLDAYKLLPIEASERYDFDASFAYNDGKYGIGVGYDFVYDAGFIGGDIHADVSIAATKNIAIEGHYNLTAFHATSIGEWSAGLRLTF